MTVTICDQCGAGLGGRGLTASIEADEVTLADKDFCSWECLARWSTNRATTLESG